MQPVLDVSDIRGIEDALGYRGLDVRELMRRAGSIVAFEAMKLVEGGAAVVICGPGNNGGDGWVAAEEMAKRGVPVRVVCAQPPSMGRDDLLRSVSAAAIAAGATVTVATDLFGFARLLGDADVVVDAVFGTGFHGALPEPYASWATVVNEYFEGSVLSVDVPSGVDAMTGAIMGQAFFADTTVTMFAVKPGLVSGDGRGASGRVVVVDLASDKADPDAVTEAAMAFVLGDGDYDDVLPRADENIDKYGRGTVLVVGGSTRFPGAAIMAAQAAARSGAGYVTLAVPQPVVPIAQMHLVDIPVIGLPADADGVFLPASGERVASLAGRFDAIVAGPGMTVCPGTAEIVRSLLASEAALVLDADALNVFERICDGPVAGTPEVLRRGAPLVLTPHRREFSRLSGRDVNNASPMCEVVGAVRDFVWSVGSENLCVAAKGPLTVVASTDAAYLPEPGPTALATAGSGDVLAGMIAGQVSCAVACAREQGAELEGAELLGIVAAVDRAHALAGELAVKEHGTRGVVATDLIAEAGLALDLLEERAVSADGQDDADDADEDGDDAVESADDAAGDAAAGEDATDLYDDIPEELLSSDFDFDLEECDLEECDLPEDAGAAEGAEEPEEAEESEGAEDLGDDTLEAEEPEEAEEAEEDAPEDGEAADGDESDEGADEEAEGDADDAVAAEGPEGADGDEGGDDADDADEGADDAVEPADDGGDGAPTVGLATPDELVVIASDLDEPFAEELPAEGSGPETAPEGGAAGYVPADQTAPLLVVPAESDGVRPAHGVTPTVLPEFLVRAIVDPRADETGRMAPVEVDPKPEALTPEQEEYRKYRQFHEDATVHVDMSDFEHRGN